MCVDSFLSHSLARATRSFIKSQSHAKLRLEMGLEHCVVIIRRKSQYLWQAGSWKVSLTLIPHKSIPKWCSLLFRCHMDTKILSNAAALTQMPHLLLFCDAFMRLMVGQYLPRPNNIARNFFHWNLADEQSKQRVCFWCHWSLQRMTPTINIFLSGLKLDKDAPTH